MDPRDEPIQGDSPVADDEWSTLAQLCATAFRHLGTLGLAAVAGLLVLLETGVLDPSWMFWSAVAFFILGALCANDGEWSVIDGYHRRGQQLKKLRYYRLAATLLHVLGGILIMAALTI